jgi:hypothetical protein
LLRPLAYFKAQALWSHFSMPESEDISLSPEHASSMRLWRLYSSSF